MRLLLQTIVSCQTAVAVVELYRASDKLVQQIIRLAYPRLQMEFDAIDRDEDRKRRIKAKQAGT